MINYIENNRFMSGSYHHFMGPLKCYLNNKYDSRDIYIFMMKGLHLNEINIFDMATALKVSKLEREIEFCKRIKFCFLCQLLL